MNKNMIKFMTMYKEAVDTFIYFDDEILKNYIQIVQENGDDYII